MPLNLKTQIKILAIINVIFLIVIGYTAILMFPYLFHQERDSKLMAEISVIQKISDPDNKSTGVWAELTLSNPQAAKTEQVRFYIVSSEDDLLARFWFNESSGNAAYRNGFYFKFHDENHDVMVNIGDRIHVYGQNMTGKILVIDVVGYSGNAQVDIK